MAYHLKIDGLTVSMGDKERQFTLRTGQWSIAAGEVIGLTGPSGTGKTLLLELLGLLRAPDAGNYFAEPMDDVDAATQDFAAFWRDPDAMALCAEARARFFGFVPQAGGLLPFLSVRDNIEISQRIARRPDAAWIKTLTNELGLSHVVNLYPAALSIGQRQRVAIARALAHRPFCVIADEPTAALDPENAQNAMRLLIEAAQAGGAATVLSSHDFTTLSNFSLRRMALSITSSPQETSVISELTPVENRTASNLPKEPYS